jgi:hypothetical protein
MIPGKKPASATPSRKRATYNCGTLLTKPVSMATAPQVIRMRAIQIRAPILCNAKLLGISKREYPKKKTPARNPNCWLVTANSLFMVSAANPMLMRSRKAMT